MDEPEQTMSDPAGQPTARKPRPRGGPFGWLLLYTRGLIIDQHLRRLTMFYVVLAAMLMVFCGDLFLGNWMQPREHFFRFAIYWLACGWLTIVAALLAVYDLLMVHLQARLTRRALQKNMLGREALDEERKK